MMTIKTLRFCRFDPTYPRSAEKHQNERYWVLGDAFYIASSHFSREIRSDGNGIVETRWVKPHINEVNEVLDLIAGALETFIRREGGDPEELHSTALQNWLFDWLNDGWSEGTESLPDEILIGDKTVSVRQIISAVAMLYCDMAAGFIDDADPVAALAASGPLHTLIQLLESFDDRIVKQAGKAIKAAYLNDARHERNRETRKLACAEWDKDRTKYPSAEKAGRFISEQLESIGRTGCAPRTVTAWIRDHAKANGVKLR